MYFAEGIQIVWVGLATWWSSVDQLVTCAEASIVYALQKSVCRCSSGKCSRDRFFDSLYTHKTLTSLQSSLLTSQPHLSCPHLLAPSQPRKFQGTSPEVYWWPSCRMSMSVRAKVIKLRLIQLHIVNNSVFNHPNTLHTVKVWGAE